jgi:hypothetical protein
MAPNWISSLEGVYVNLEAPITHPERSFEALKDDLLSRVGDGYLGSGSRSFSAMLVVDASGFVQLVVMPGVHPTNVASQ